MINFKKKNHEILFWKALTNFWGILTATVFYFTFFKIWNLGHILTEVAVIYLSILSIFTSIKEFDRWKSKDYLSKYHGEIFILAWTMLMLIFIAVSATRPDYQLYSQFTATYLSVLGIFAITLKSKNLRKL